MANVNLIRGSGSLPYQAPGTMTWNMSGGWGGDRDNFWGWSARPYQANSTVVLNAVSANQDNNLSNSTDLTVTVISSVGGTLLRFTVIGVTG